jgi:hypothetical protein
MSFFYNKTSHFADVLLELIEGSCEKFNKMNFWQKKIEGI